MTSHHKEGNRIDQVMGTPAMVIKDVDGIAFNMRVGTLNHTVLLRTDKAIMMGTEGLMIDPSHQKVTTLQLDYKREVVIVVTLLQVASNLLEVATAMRQGDGEAGE